MPESNNFNNALALIITIGFLAIVGVMLFHEVPESSKDMLGPLIGGVIGAALSTIVQYKWGSSAGSAAKSETISRQMPGTGDGSSTVSSTEKIVSEKTVNTEKTIPPILPWAVGTPYKVGDHVTVGTEKYRALTNHTSTPEDEPGTGPSWTAVWERQV